MFATSLPVAQWVERLTGVRKVMGSIPIGDSDFFFVSRSQHVDYSIFSDIKSCFHFNFKAKIDCCMRYYLADTCILFDSLTVIFSNTSVIY